MCICAVVSAGWRCPQRAGHHRYYPALAVDLGKGSFVECGDLTRWNSPLAFVDDPPSGSAKTPHSASPTPSIAPGPKVTTRQEVVTVVILADSSGNDR